MSDSEYQHVIIEGVPVQPGQAPGLRREFSEWAKDHKNNIQVSLFIRALQRLYDRPYTETLSYFQIASIHGYPGDLNWDNSAPPTYPSKDKKHYMYCTHNRLNFSTWHRPYMVLFEQTVWKAMGEVIDEDLKSKFHSEADRQTWIDERNKWRLPYWDWAANGNVPDLFVPPAIEIRVPLAADGSQPEPEFIPNNPLYRYQLRENGRPVKMGDLPSPYTVSSVPLEADGTEYPWDKCSGTSRWGITNSVPAEKWSQGINNATKASDAINNHKYYLSDAKEGDEPYEIYKHPVSDLIHRLMCGVDTWENFATAAINSASKDVDWKQWVSLEYIHNNLHLWIGGGGFDDGVGHMQNVPAAAFDPIFYVHHANIDRLLATWQTLHDKQWFDDSSENAEKLGKSTDPLTPFHGRIDDPAGKRPPVDYFNSDDVRDWTKFGYQYDTLERKEGEADDKHIKNIIKFIDKTYPNTGRILLKDKSKLINHAERSVESDDGSSAEMFDDYLITILYDRYALDGEPYIIHFFLGAPGVSVGIQSSWSSDAAEEEGDGVARINLAAANTAPRHVGLVYNFSSPIGRGNADGGGGGPPSCGNCAVQQEEKVLSSALLPLTIPLYHAAADITVDDLSGLEPEQVESYLKSKLSWVAVTISGKIIPWERLPETKVFILQGRAKHFREHSKLSSYREYEPLGTITNGRQAGASLEDYGV